MDKIRFPVNSGLATLLPGFRKEWVLVGFGAAVARVDVAVVVAAVVDDCYIVALAAVLAQLKGADDVAAGGVEDSVGVENRECMEAFESPQHLESNWKGRTIA